MICQIVHANDDKRRLGEEIVCKGKKRFFLPIFFTFCSQFIKGTKRHGLFPLDVPMPKLK